MRAIRHALALVPSFAVLLAFEPRADACGGCFHPPKENPTVVTDHRMIFAVSQKQTTLYDQMRYTGAPSSFAWVLPIAEKVTVGLSSDELFSVLDVQTGVQVVAPEMNCYVPPSCVMPSRSMVGSAAAPGGGGGGGGGVTVFAHEVVGPYETVQLRATDPKALASWLSAHHYEIPPDAQAIVDGYVKEKSAFLAMKLVPGATVQAMRPVRVTSPGASVTLPLRMVAAGAGATLGVTLWVVSDGRYEPQNFPFFTIGAPELSWDWKTSSSNYSTVRAQKTKNADGTGWLIESSLDLATQDITSELRYSVRPRPRRPVTRLDGGRAEAGRDGGAEKTQEEQHADDLAVLFGGTGTPASTIRVTRMRADLSHAALSRDLRVRASSDQAMLSNVVQVTREDSPPSCPVYDEKCAIVGNAPRAEAEAKNKVVATPQVANGDPPKKSPSCSASPRAASLDAPVALIGLALAGAALARRRASSPPHTEL